MIVKSASLACAALLLSSPAAADTELDTLRAEIRELRASYEARLAALEARLRETEANAEHAAARIPAVAEPAATGKLNPDISLILQGQYAQRDAIDERHISGFLPAGHAHGSERGLSIDHTELVLSASVDPLWLGYATFALADEAVEVEEAWFQTLALGGGVTVKGGRFYSSLGYLNQQHPHAWDFVDAPLMYRALFGERFSHDGLQLRWLAPTDAFLEIGIEAGNGAHFPGGGNSGNGIGAWSAFAKTGGDVGASHSWRAGLAYLHARPRGREGHWQDLDAVETATFLSGSSEAWIADLVWKWAPDGNARERNFKLQAEYFHRREQGDMVCTDADPALPSLCTAGLSDAYGSSQSGMYLQAVYQFMPRWRVGTRFDLLDSGDTDFGTLPLAASDHDPDRWSLMADWSPSEFSRLRLQYARDNAMQGVTEDQWTLQYIMSLGAHGAHGF